MRIALDVDGVLADIISVWLDEYNAAQKKAVTKQDIEKWDFWKELGYDKYRFYGDLSKCWSRWISIPAEEDGIADAVRQLGTLGTVDIVTARDPPSTRYVKQWLEHNDIVYDHYVAVASGRAKAELDYDVFIDDSPVNAASIASRGRRTLLYDQPWNRSVSDSRITRIRKLAEAVDVIRSIPSAL